ncbi:MAG: PQQ-binding-like beta-propeller repeat protein, partial [Candidatus Thermoplasmatota archaeon]
MKSKIFVLTLSLLLIISGVMVVFGGETASGEGVNESVESESEPSDLADSPWPCFGRDENNTSRSPYNTSHVDGTEKWTFPTGDQVFSSPSIGTNGTIYFGSKDNNLYAVYTENGTEKWSFETGGPVGSSPAIASDGTIYVGALDNHLYAVNPDGTEKWNFTMDGNVSSSPAIGSDGTIYFGSLDN